jgi:predicted DNA-binding transcriptional regulator AlpA
MEELISPAEVSTAIGIPEKTLEHWRTHNIGPNPCHLGRHVRYRTRDWQEYLEQKFAG